MTTILIVQSRACGRWGYGPEMLRRVMEYDDGAPFWTAADAERHARGDKTVPKRARFEHVPAPLVVEQSHAGNPDIGGGYHVPMDREGRHDSDVRTLRQASMLCRLYIERNQLGGGNWTGGAVRNAEGKIVARVSYNGRVWRPDGTEVTGADLDR